MAHHKMSSVVGVFEDRMQADRAVSELRAAGFRDDQIGVAMRGDDASVAGSTTDEAADDDSHAGTGAMTGMVAGAGLGALAGLGILAGVIPVIGPAIAGGTLGILLSNAAAGAGLAGLAGALIGAGIPEEEATYYQGEFEAGRTIVTVQADARGDEAAAILRRNGAYDMQTRGTTGTASASSHTSGSSYAGTGTASHAAAHTAHGGETIELREEKLQAHTRPVEAGEVRVRKEVTTEHQTIEVPVEREEVVIERRPVHGQHASSSEIRPGEEIRIPVREEEVVVDKQAVVKEEVSVGKRVVQDTQRVAGEVREEHLRVERKGDVDVRGDSTGRSGK